jgi:FkbM family methyltransferase
MKLRDRLRLLHRAYRYAWRTERYEIALVRALVRPGECVVDVGAHKAAFAYWMARAVGPRGLVLAFEPMPELASYLRVVAASFPCGQLQFIEAALSNCAGRAMLHFAGDHLGTASIEIQEDKFKPPVEVRTETLDGLLAARNSDCRVSFIKCDVEHHELAVFQGARETLSQAKPILLFESANLANGQDCNQKVFGFLQSLGFVGYFFDRGRLVPVTGYEPARHHAPTVNQNFVFTHPNRVSWQSLVPPYSVRYA